ncbi:ubiquitin conjugation factor E4 A [Mytilus galloprovincialis]|nr:ubiquitin conjugation factor E4 A [Mytilus galloprovincialis]
MGTLMKDPVILPSSGNIVDRSTIARHLLSDQNDPFNREALSLDMVIPHAELQEKIEAWKEEHRNKS